MDLKIKCGLALFIIFLIVGLVVLLSHSILIESLYDYHRDSGYWITAIGEQCPSEKAIEYESECQDAGYQLGIKLKTDGRIEDEFVPFNRFCGENNPPGCSYNGKSSNDPSLCFNRDVDPSSSSKSVVCRKPGISGPDSVPTPKFDPKVDKDLFYQLVREYKKTKQETSIGFILVIIAIVVLCSWNVYLWRKINQISLSTKEATRLLEEEQKSDKA